MELETTENMFLPECNQQTEYPQSMFLSNQQEIQTVEEPSEILEEKEQPLYKLNNINTEASIKSELKQIILTKISEEINSKTLNDMSYTLEEQINFIKTRTETLQNKIQELKQEVDSDETRLTQSESILLKTQEMIGLLHENIEKLTVKIRDCYIVELSNKTVKQHESLLEKLYLKNLEKAKEKLKEIKFTTIQRLNKLKDELLERDNIYKNSKEKHEEFEKLINTSDSDLQEVLFKKEFLEAKLVDVMNKKSSLEQDLKNQQGFNRKEEDLNLKFEEFTKQKQDMELKLNKISEEIVMSETDLVEYEAKIENKEKELLESRESLKTNTEDFQIIKKKLQEEKSKLVSRLNDLITQNTSSQTNNEKLLLKLNDLKSQYLQKVEQKFCITNSFLQKFKNMHEIKQTLLKKEMENKTEKIKYEELKNQYETALDLLKSLVEEIEKTKDNNNEEQTKLKIKHELTHNEQKKLIIEIGKKKEYLIVNSKFLQEKSENSKLELNELEKNVNNLKEENKTTKLLIENKLKQLEDSNKKLNNLQKNDLKSLLKSPKKESVTKNVKFSDILSFKSPTSSEFSIPVNDNPLESSFHDWLKESGKFPASEQIEEEF